MSDRRQQEYSSSSASRSGQVPIPPRDLRRPSTRNPGPAPEQLDPGRPDPRRRQQQAEAKAPKQDWAADEPASESGTEDSWAQVG